MPNLSLDLKNTGITTKNIMEYKQEVEKIHKELHKRAKDKKDFVRMVRTSNKL